MVTEIATYRRSLEQLKGQRQGVQDKLESRKLTLDTLEKRLDNASKAQGIIQLVGQQTQQKLEAHISNLVSMALAAVFEDPYKLLIEFVLRRGKTECDVWFVRRGEKVSPMDAAGGGAVDVAALAFRIALWSLSKNKYRSTLLLDEPMKHLSKDLHSNASAMIQQISQKLGLQIIMVTHSPDLVECSDKVFTVTVNKEGISSVTER